jgi:hypothetical protein
MNSGSKSRSFEDRKSSVEDRKSSVEDRKSSDHFQSKIDLGLLGNSIKSYLYYDVNHSITVNVFYNGNLIFRRICHPSTNIERIIFMCCFSGDLPYKKLMLQHPYIPDRYLEKDKTLYYYFLPNIAVNLYACLVD